MKRCYKCNVDINSSSSKCPLCGNDIDDVIIDTSVFPVIPNMYVKHGLFFKLLLLYICSNEISSVYWAQSFGEKEMNVMIKQVDNVMEWYDQCDSYIPKWYHK